MAKRGFMVALVAVAATGCGDDEASPSGSTGAGGIAGSGGVAGSGGAGTAGAGAVGGEGCEAGSLVVSFSTDDDLTLEADLHLTGESDGPAAVLLHMIPPANDRTNYSEEFIQLLTSAGISVLNVDRRGAGASQGEPMDAYLGDAGRLDAKAAVDFLQSHACGFDEKRLALVGASNGTTTAVDYAAGADELGAPLPAALVFLTGGSYTENQTVIVDNDIFAELPILFVYSSDEASWSESFSSTAGPAWQFDEYDPGGHGTAMFDVQPDAMAAVRDFLAAAL